MRREVYSGRMSQTAVVTRTTSVRLGKNRPKFDSRTLLFGAYTTKNLPSPPSSVDYSKAVTSWPMMGNDTNGDCTCAAAGHMIEEWTANTGTQKTLPDTTILSAYRHFAGSDPDAGASMLDVLKYWRKTGIGGDKIMGFVQLQPRSTIQVKDSISLFGNCYIGVSLPDFAVSANANVITTPWVVPPQGPVGDAAPNPDNGHCIPAVGYDDRNLYVVTWGTLKMMSWEFYQTYMDEAFAVLSHDWISQKLGTAPSGFNLATLQQDLSSVETISASSATMTTGGSGSSSTTGSSGAGSSSGTGSPGSGSSGSGSSAGSTGGSSTGGRSTSGPSTTRL